MSNEINKIEVYKEISDDVRRTRAQKMTEYASEKSRRNTELTTIKRDRLRKKKEQEKKEEEELLKLEKEKKNILNFSFGVLIFVSITIFTIILIEVFTDISLFWLYLIGSIVAVAVITKNTDIIACAVIAISIGILALLEFMIDIPWWVYVIVVALVFLGFLGINMEKKDSQLREWKN